MVRRFSIWNLLLLVIPLFAWNTFASELKYGTVVRARVEERLRAVSRDNSERELTLKKMFDEVGCGPHISEFKVKRIPQPDLLCVLPGQSDSTIIVGAHFDHVEKGMGVVDNWSGASLLPSLYQGLATEARRHTYIFIAFAGEEKGELGSAAYVNGMSKDEVARTVAMINMDTLGLGPTKVWMSHADRQLARALYEIAGALRLPISAVNVDDVGSTDSEQFARRKIPRITVHSLTQQTLTVLHSNRDQLDAMQLADYYDSYRLLQAYLVFLDDLERPAPEAARH